METIYSEHVYANILVKQFKKTVMHDVERRERGGEEGEEGEVGGAQVTVNVIMNSL